MKRLASVPRSSWEKTVESQGLLWHTTDDGTYWNEKACYEFTSSEVDKLEAATNDLHAMCLEAGQYIIDRGLFRKMNISIEAEFLIRKSWEQEPPAIYGRFDLAYDGSKIKLLEYNADTPTSLLEAAVIQWYWLQDTHRNADQFNSIHERLVKKWRELSPYVGDNLKFASLETREDSMTITYLIETAKQAGLFASPIRVPDIGHDSATGQFMDMDERTITTLFKLYPWEMMLTDEFGSLIRNSSTQFMEPAWKMMWSNKALLAILWEMYPDHELLLPAYFENNAHKLDWTPHVVKPFHSREGANIRIVDHGVTMEETGGQYDGPVVYQQLFPLPQFDGRYPVIGSWVIDGEAAGIGIREADSRITGNTSQFVPHFFLS